MMKKFLEYLICATIGAVLMVICVLFQVVISW